MSSHAEETPNVADRGGVAGPSALVLAEAGRGGVGASAAEPKRLADQSLNRLSFWFENDSFAAVDRYYTNGAKIAWQLFESH